MAEDELVRRRRLRKGFEGLGIEHPDLKSPEHRERLTEYLETELAQEERPERRSRGRPSKGIAARFRQVSLYLPPELLQELDRIADLEQQRFGYMINRTDLIRLAITEFVNTRLEAPKNTPSPTSPIPSASSISPILSASPTPIDTGELPEAWQRVIAFMRLHPDPQRLQGILQGVGLGRNGKDIVRRMCDRGLLRRVGKGMYELS